METYYKNKYDNWVLDNIFMLRKGMKKEQQKILMINFG